jgi:hypothetical protein
MFRVALIIMLWGCTKARVSSIELEAVELPGFTIKLPAVDEPAANDPREPRPENSYIAGSVKRSRNSTLIVEVEWKLGQLADDKTLAEIRRVTAADLDHPLARPASGLPTRSFRAKLEGHPLLITEIACGARRFEIWTTSDALDLEALQRSILATARCHPDLAQEKPFASTDLDRAIGWNRREARIDLASRAGWMQMESPKGVLILGRADGTSLLVMVFENEPSGADLKLLFRSDPLEIGTGDPRPLRGTAKGTPTRGWMHALNCGADGWMLIAYLELDNERPPGGKDVVTGARCLDRGVPPVSWPGL